MSIRIENFSKEHIDAVIAFEKELRQQEPNTYFWEIDEQYIRNMQNSFEDSRFSESAVSLLAYQEDRHKGVAQLLLQSLKSVLKEKNIDTLVILTAGNEEATKFYDTCEDIEFCRGAMIHI